jgi:hypothetical protein
MSVRKITTRCVITQKSAVLIYFAGEAWNHKIFVRVNGMLRASLLTATETKNSSSLRLVQESKSQIRLQNRHHNDMHSSEKMSKPSIIVGRIMNQKLNGNHSTYAAENVCVRMRSDAILQTWQYYWNKRSFQIWRTGKTADNHDNLRAINPRTRSTKRHN